MLQLIAEMFTYPFMVRALCMGTLVALCAAVLGVTLVLKRFSFIGDGFRTLPLERSPSRQF